MTLPGWMTRLLALPVKDDRTWMRDRFKMAAPVLLQAIDDAAMKYRNPRFLGLRGRAMIFCDPFIDIRLDFCGRKTAVGRCEVYRYRRGGTGATAGEWLKGLVEDFDEEMGVP